MSKPKPAEPLKPGASAPPDERDATIARLERAVADERQNAATLREANDALTFKLQILEKSYAKQLADARAKMETAQKALAGHESRLAELGSGGEDTLRALGETRAELNRLKADYSLLKEQAKRGGGGYGKGRGAADPVDGSDGSQTINALITSAALAPSRDRAASSDSNQNQRVRVDDSPVGDMVAPDLIFTKNDKDDDKAH
jgi:hypothetical protein